MTAILSSYANGPTARGRVYRMGARGWLLLLLLAMLAGFGVAMLYSVGGDPTLYTAETPWWERGSWTPWAAAHALRFALALGVMIVAATAIPLRFWRHMAYPAYFGALALLVGVEFYGETNMGATRWILIGPIRVQPSEVMKLSIVLALARYYHDLDYRHARGVFPIAHIPPLVMIAIPAFLIVRQPDLGTALLVVGAGVVVVFLSGVRWTHIFLGGLGGLFGVIFLFFNGLRPYQRERIITFLNADSTDQDFQLGSGYHTLQAKIALGSGGVTGKGFGAGTQTQLDFLPEKQTDFIFTVIGEELGFVGCAALLAVTAAILVLGVSIAMSSRHHFGRLAAMGACAIFAFYVFINVAMNIGVAPVVGVPFPLVSWGGTAMIVVMTAFGVVLNVHLNQDEELARGGGRG
ncbi:MAG: rod shape-determining protein RodA [Maricaulaceae bacterium]|jgi:rod shape determining protein RodA